MGLNDTPMLDTRTEPKKIVFERRVRPGAAISTAVPVAALTWFVMPWTTRLLYGWLYAGRELTRSGGGA